MRPIFVLALSAATALTAMPAQASDRYRERPPVMVSPDLSAPWVMQLGEQPARVQRRVMREVPANQRLPRRVMRNEGVRVEPDVTPAAVTRPAKQKVRREMNPIFLPQEVAYSGSESPGTVVIDTRQNFLYLVGSGGTARRYGVGTGKPGFEWAGTHKVTRKQEWPDWRPPAQMIAREKAKGKYLPTYLAGGPENPLGARALYLGSTLYRIHGTNQPWTIGGAVSSGCIRMRNEDVTDLYERVPVGATVVVM
ncbi:L,D-transpeptidase [Mesorhizobium sp. RP14(2022)]|uniref:L,D-transpeptidase n=1 Tax=Mesorhizobium liriopis TaxID=2953882 RepID=A0ABT1C2H6_9HYPH|nr:L,D-transpeptidase [Mesorhizobium liriopis]MCO6048440.1 L,D-transpeptidase [Mesorhizobium liriopis]